MLPVDPMSPGLGAGRLRSMHDVDQALRVLRELEAVPSQSLDREATTPGTPANASSAGDAPLGATAVLKALADSDFDLFAAAVRLAHDD